MVVDYLGTTLAALSDPTRRSIVDRLAHGPATVNELAAPFAISQQAISKHLAYLHRARLIEKQTRGRQHFCALVPNGIREVAKWTQNYRQLWEKRFRHLDALLDEMKAAQAKTRPTQQPPSSRGRKQNLNPRHPRLKKRGDHQ